MSPSPHGLRPVRDAHRFDEAALQRWLVANVPSIGVTGEAAAPLELRQFEGGQSNPTFLLTIGDRRLVLRKKPPGVLLPSAHAVEREFQVMRALAGSEVPVPEALALCEDASIIGTPFYVMAHVDGRLFWDVRVPELSRDDRSALYHGFVSTLAALHRVDYAARGLATFGKPAAYLARQVQRWSQQFEASRTGASPAMDAIMAWLPTHVPAGDEGEATALTHGDFRIDNLIVEKTGAPKVVAVLDWELSTLGHPLADLAHACMPYRLTLPGGRGGLLGADFAALGIPDEAALLDEYCALTARVVPRAWPYFIAFVLFRMASIVQGVYKRSLQGNASSSDAVTYGAAVGVLAERACEVVGIAASS